MKTQFQILKELAEEHGLRLEIYTTKYGDEYYHVVNDELLCSDECLSFSEVEESIRDLSSMKEK